MTTNDPREYYVLHLPDGRYLHHVPQHIPGLNSQSGTTLHSTEGPLTPLAGRPTWWAADHFVTGPVTARWTPYPQTTGYRLKNPDDETKHFPASLTTREFNVLEDRFGEVVFDLYAQVNEERPEQTEELNVGPWRLLEGELPPQEPDRRWIPDLPRSLATHPEYGWWLPGKLIGLFDAVKAHAESKRLGMFAVSQTTKKYDGVEGWLKVEYNVPFQRPVTRVQTHDFDGRKLRRPKTVPETVKRPLILPVPQWVTGDNYAAALTAWNAEYATWTALIDSMVGVKACNHCGGLGHVPDGAEQYTPAPVSRNETL